MLKFISKKQKKEIIKYLEKPYNIEKLKISHKFLKDNRDKIYIINKKIDEIELNNYKLDLIGLYFCTLIHNEIRLSVEGSQLIGKYAKKNT